MLMFLIDELATRGAEHHNKKMIEHRGNKTEHSYHARMMCIYTDILGLTLQARKLNK